MTAEQLDVYGGATPLSELPSKKLTSVATSVSIAHKRALLIEARRRQCSVAALIREAVHDWLARNVRAS